MGNKNSGTKYIDLTGKVFGRLTVLEKSEHPLGKKEKRAYWLCQCECGNQKIILGRSLRDGKTLSCGCLQKEKVSGVRVDLTGQKFNRLTVLCQSDRLANNGKILWDCSCDCGSFVSRVNGTELKSGHIKSCGCLKKESLRKKRIDLTGKKFNKWYVIKYNHTNSQGIAYWLCKCECGTERIISGGNLKGGKSKSCGCLQKQIVFEKNSLPIGESSGLNVLYKNYINSANARHLVFCLSKDDFEKLTKQNCRYCGIEPRQIKKPTNGNVGIYIYNGIDRIDSKKGYTVDNCVPCCGNCNYAKKRMTEEEFKEWVKRIYNYFVKNENG